MDAAAPPVAALEALQALALPDPPVGPPRHRIARGVLGEAADGLLHDILDHESEFFDNDPGRLGYRRGRALAAVPELTDPIAEVSRHALDGWCEAFDVDVGDRGADAALEIADVAVTAFADGDFLSMHRDDGRHSTPKGRVVSFVYWLHHRPAPFGGGELRLCGWARHEGALVPAPPAVDLVPEHDVLVAFPSSTMHEVFRVHSESGHFADARFAVTGFARRRGGRR